MFGFIKRLIYQFFRLFWIIDRWLNPYKYYYDDEELGNLQEKAKSVRDKVKNMSPQEMINNNIIGVEFQEIDDLLKPGNNVVDAVSGLDYDVLLYLHTKNRHQLAGMFESNSFFRYQHRDDQARKRLKPLLYPKGNKPFDRTHVIPIGYHGSENDARIVVGWNGEQNRNAIKDFESEVRKFNTASTIIWFADIRKEDNGLAVWDAYIYDRNGNELIKGHWEDPDPFVWK